MFTVLALLAFTSSSIAAPFSLFSRDLREYRTDISIHESCNVTQQRILKQAFRDTFEVATFAKEYVATNGPKEATFQLYFGDDTSSFVSVLGAYDALLTSNKAEVLFRCDDPDGNCQIPGYNGHWRGDNGSQETVICDASYYNRRFNTEFCSRNYQLAKDKPSVYWSIDLIHRLFHVPAIANQYVDHFTKDLAGVVELGAHNGSFAVRDSNALQYFAAHVYAVEVVQGGDQCIGEISHDDHNHDHVDNDDHTDVSSSSSSAEAAAGSTAPSTTTSAAEECHTHSDGTEHCV